MGSSVGKERGKEGEDEALTVVVPVAACGGEEEKEEGDEEGGRGGAGPLVESAEVEGEVEEGEESRGGEGQRRMRSSFRKTQCASSCISKTAMKTTRMKNSQVHSGETPPAHTTSTC